MADLDAVVVGCGPGPVHRICGWGWPPRPLTDTRWGCRCTGCARWTPSARELPVRCWWSPTPAVARCTGPATATVFASRAPPSAPGRRAGGTGSGPCASSCDLHPDPPAGLVAAVADWDADPDPLVPLYLRRPDAKTLAERGAVEIGAAAPERRAAGDQFARRRLRPIDPPRRRPVRRIGDGCCSVATTPGRSWRSCGNWPPRTTATSRRGWTGHWSATPASPDWAAAPPFEYEIHTIGVDPAYQGRGIGRAMMTRLLDWAGHDSVVFLEVRTDNEPAMALYKSLGFDTRRSAQALLPCQRR